MAWEWSRHNPQRHPRLRDYIPSFPDPDDQPGAGIDHAGSTSGQSLPSGASHPLAGGSRGPGAFGAAPGRGRGGWGGRDRRRRGEGHRDFDYHDHLEQLFSRHRRRGREGGEQDSGSDDEHAADVAANRREAGDKPSEKKTPLANEKDGSPDTSQLDDSDTEEKHPDPPEVSPQGAAAQERGEPRRSWSNWGSGGWGRRGGMRGHGPLGHRPHEHNRPYHPWEASPFQYHGPPRPRAHTLAELDFMLEAVERDRYAPLFDEFLNRQAQEPDRWDGTTRNNGDSTDAKPFSPPVDIFSTPTGWTLHVALPGARKEDVNVRWDGDSYKGVLSISGVVHRPGGEDFLAGMVSGERKVGSFSRLIKLPPDDDAAASAAHRGEVNSEKEKKEREREQIDGEGISGTLKDGILVINVPVVEREWTEVRKVDIE